MKNRATILIINPQNELLVIKRFYGGEHYYVFPGGKTEPGESIKDAAIREAKEETSLDVILDKEIWTFENPNFDDIHHVFTIKEYSGTPALSGEEAEANCDTDSYELKWIPLSKIDEFNLKPTHLKALIVKKYSK